ncbi:MAG TPA: PAS domain S-box protein [Gemmataceae bacterium]|nr:PAS domain S-box protein [Gemmataceae bacterium]
MRISFGQKIGVSFGLTFVVLSVFGLILYANTRRLADTTAQVEQSHRLRVATGEVLGLLRDAESGVRGFALTGDERYLGPYEGGTAQVPQVLAELRRLTADLPDQRRRLDELEPVIVGQLDEGLAVILARREEGLEGAREHLGRGHGERLMDEVRGQVAAMERSADGVLQERKGRAEAAAFRNSATILVGYLLLLAGLVANGRVVLREARRSEKFARRARGTIDALSARLCVLDQSGTILAVNAAWRAFAEASPPVPGNVCEGANYLQVCDSATGPGAEVAAAFASGLRGILKGERDEFVLEYPWHSRHDRRWFIVRATHYVDAGRRYLVVTHVNITARKLAEDALRTAEERLELAVRAGNVGLWDRNIHTTRVYYSATWKGQLGYEDHEIGDGAAEWEGRLHPDDRAMSVSFFRDYIRSPGGDYEAEFRLRHKDGSYRWILSRGSVLRDAEGHPCRLLGVHIDVTQRKNAELALRESEERYRTVATAVPGILFSWGPDGAQRYASPYFYEYTGLPRGAVEDRGWTAALHPEDRELLEQHWLAWDGQPFEAEFRLRGADGIYRWFLGRGVPQRDVYGRVVECFGACIDIDARKRAEGELRKFKIIADNANDMVCIADRAARFHYVNRTFCVQLGYSEDQLLSLGIPDIDPRVDLQNYQAGFDLAQREATPPFETVHRRSDGSTYRVEVSCIGIRLDGQPFAAAFVRSIEARKRAEEALRASEERLRLVIEATNDGIWDWDAASNSTFCSERLYQLIGVERSSAQLTNESLNQLLHPDDRERHAHAFRAHVGAGDPYQIEVRLRRHDGTYGWFLLRGQALRDGDGRPVRMLGSVTDVTERRRAEERIREQAALLDRVSDAIVALDLAGCVTFWNHGAERAYGWSGAEARGQDLARLLFGGDDWALAEAGQGLAERDEWAGELTPVTRAGQRLVVESHWTVVRDEARRHTATLILTIDVTEKKQLEARFLRAQRLESIGVLAGGIAHDINNLLTPILITLQLLAKDRPEGSRAKLLATAEASVRRAADMVRHLLAFAGGTVGELLPLRLQPVIHEVVALLDHTLSKSVAITASVPDDLWVVSGDMTQLSQLLMNLCVNAGDAMPRGGNLRVAAANEGLDGSAARKNPDARAGAYVVVTVTDTGLGMSPEILEKIFDPFFTTKEQGKGTGLGLSTALGIVKGHGGFLNVVSEVGKGTRFAVYLPAVGAAETRPEAAEHRTPEAGHEEVILLVDDEANILLVTRAMLESHGYHVLSASGGAEAVEVFRQHNGEIRAVILDMVMPEMDGPSTLQALRQLDPGVRVIACSGLPPLGRAAPDVRVGARAFLPKPFSREQLLRAVALVLRAK